MVDQSIVVLTIVIEFRGAPLMTQNNIYTFEVAMNFTVIALI